MEITNAVASRDAMESIVTQRYYVATGKNRVTVEARNAREAADEAIDRIVNDDSMVRSMGQLTSISLHGFDLDSDDDILTLTTAVMERIGFRKNKNGELVRCKTCRGVGRLDCCERIDCLDCGGLFTKDCPDC